MPEARRLSVGVVAIVLTVVIANLGNNIVSPLMPILRQQFGSSAGEISLMASGFGLGRLMMDLPAGALTDRISPTRLFTAGILVSAIGAALAAFSTGLAQLIFFRTIMGFGSAIMATVALVLMARIAPPGQRGTILGFYFSAQLVGQAVSPSIGGYLAALFDWRAAFIFCALTPFISFPMNLLVASKTEAVQSAGEVDKATSRMARGTSANRGGDAGLRSLPTWPALAAVFFGTFGNFFNRNAMRLSILPLYAGMVLGLDTGTIGLILTTGSLVTIAINLPSGFLADRVGKKTLLVPGLLTLVVGNLVFFAGDSTPIFVAGTMFISMGVLSNSMQTALVADLVPESLLGRGMGLYRFTADLGTVAGPMVMGLIVDQFGFHSAELFGAFVVILGITATIAFIPTRTGQQPVARTA